MAIERYGPLSLAELKDLIDGLGWFAASDESTGVYAWYADEEKQKCVLRIEFSATNPLVKFSHNGSMTQQNTDYIQGTITGGSSFYVYKTKNGLLISTQTQYMETYWYQWSAMIGKTDSGAVAMVMQTTTSTPNIVNTSAYGESIVGAFNYSLRYNASNNFPAVSQIVTVPIPTAPSSGTSYIKNALGLILAPWHYYWGEIDIGGVRYATNGYLALNDED